MKMEKAEMLHCIMIEQMRHILSSNKMMDGKKKGPESPFILHGFPDPFSSAQLSDRRSSSKSQSVNAS